MKAQEALEFICQQALNQGADEFDALAGETESMGVDLFEGKVKNTEISFSRGIGIRVFKGKKPGYAFTEKFSKDSLFSTVSDALSHTRLTAPLDIDIPESGNIPDLDLEIWNEDLQNVQLSEMKELGLQLESISLETDRRVENVPYLGVGFISDRSWLQNSKGIRYAVKGNSLFAGVGVVAVEGESKKMGTYSNSAHALPDLDPMYMAKTAVERGVELLGARPIPSGQYPVVFSNRVSPHLLSMYASAFFAEVVQKGQSKLEGLLDRQIASDILTMICNPHQKGFPGSRLFDGEGVLCTPLEVINQGYLMTYLYNLESAKKENRLSSGHAARSYSGQVSTAFSNLMVRKGDKSLAELLSLYPKCLYVNSLEGSSGCSAVSGEISIGIQGFWIENGSKAHPVEGVTINSNFFDLLKSLKGISYSYSDTLSSVKVPDILVESMYVAG